MRQLLSVGYGYVDIIAKLRESHVPTGDEKTVTNDYAVSYIGGNAVTATAFAAGLGIRSDLFCQVGTDRTGKTAHEALTDLGITIFPRTVHKFPVSIVIPQNGKRSITRCRDEKEDESEGWLDFPHIDVSGYMAFHTDGHHGEVALYYAQMCRKSRILTSLDGGGLRSNTDELLKFIDVAVVAERLCEQMELSPRAMLLYLQSKGCRVGAVTLGERGVFWYDEGGRMQHMPALKVPSNEIVDANGAGDFFHGGYLVSYLRHKHLRWAEHFQFARAASTYKLRHLGNEAALPRSISQIEKAGQMYPSYPREPIPA